jgi:lipopolysaccharide transport system permease protein
VADDVQILIRPHSVVSLADIADLWRYRELLWTLAKRDVSVRYKQAALGVAWAVLQPLTQMVIFTLLFNRVAGIRADSSVPYSLFVFAGLVLWLLFSTGLSRASESLVENTSLVTKAYFPRVVIPAASVLAAGVDFVVGFILLAILMPFYHQGLLHTSALLVLPIALVTALCALALGLWTSALNIQFRDVRYALPFFVQTLIFVTPVFYPASIMPAKYRLLLALNPMTALIESFRAALFAQPLPWDALGLATATTLVVAALGFLYFRRMESSFADRI